MTEEQILKTIGKVADREKLSVWAVGGFVRDKLLNKTVIDIDFAVVGNGPQFAKKVAREINSRNVVIFEKFGTAMVHQGDYQLEFVGTRAEDYDENSRKPTVTHADLDGDLSRRDFTINCIAYGVNCQNFGTIYDPLDGQADIKKKVIRTPLDPVVTFKDDPLRIMRAIRFATQLNFTIEEETFAALTEMAPRLKIISQERITDEMLKILKSTKPSIGFKLMDEVGILEFILPELINMKGVEQRKGYHHKDVYQHTLTVIDNVAQNSDKIELRLSALFHDVGKPATKKFIEGSGWTFHGHDEIGARMLPKIFRRLRLPNTYLKYTQKMTRLHLRPINLSEEGVTDSAMRRLLVRAGDDLDDLLTLCRADITSGNPERVKNHLANFDHVVQRLEEVEEKDKMKAFQSPVRGDEIMAVCGINPGPKVGQLKKTIEEAILEGIIPNDHDAAYQYLLEIKDEILAQP